MRFYMANYDFYRTEREDGNKGATASSINNGIPHTCVDLPPLLSIETTGVSMPIGNIAIFLVVVYKSPQRLWSDTDITELLGFRNKSILADELNARDPVSNSKLSNPSGLRLLELFGSP
jgi:hypothetical protein